MKVEAYPSDVARASRPLWRGHPACAFIDFAFSFDLAFSHYAGTSLVRERDAPATAGETPALRPLSPRDLTFMSPIDLLSFQRHSSYKQLSTCVFMHIPASFPTFPQRSFVFIDIPASFRQF
jgi:hypothetical protein